MDFVLNTKEQQKEMLKTIGVARIDDLFRDVPEKIRLKEHLKVSQALSEQEVKAMLFEMARQNANSTTHSYFLGAGSYNHFIPAAVWFLAGRSEFYTSYTPYQPEISQGMLQSIFEWQTSICELTGMDVCNASTYDGSEALAEAVLMAKNFTKKRKLLVSKAINPQYRQVARTYANANNLEFVEINFDNTGRTDLKELKQKLNNDVAAVFVQSPNFFGCIEDLGAVEKETHSKEALFVVAVSELVSAGLLRPPGEYNADIVIGDAQSFGIPVSFGGPYAGFVAVKEKLVRQLPGRLVGETVDVDGKKGYILTLQAREQHIRRDKATSNICTNQALFALAATIHISLLGKEGVRRLAELNLQKAHFLKQQLLRIEGVSEVFSSPHFNEFVVKIKNAKEVRKKVQEKNIIFGLLLENEFPTLKDHVLVCATETNTRVEIDKLLNELRVAMK
jgi:glycine dehydrogenase subunit 1